MCEKNPGSAICDFGRGKWRTEIERKSKKTESRARRKSMGRKEGKTHSLFCKLDKSETAWFAA
jgi:hypothetical protein